MQKISINTAAISLRLFLLGLTVTIILFVFNKEAIDIKSGEYAYITATVYDISESVDKDADKSVTTVYIKYEINNQTYKIMTDLFHIKYNIGDKIELLCDLSDPSRIVYEDKTIAICLVISIFVTILLLLLTIWLGLGYKKSNQKL